MEKKKSQRGGKNMVELNNFRNSGRERPVMNDKTAIFNQMKQKILQIQDPS